MPELPEVETVVRSLRAAGLVGVRITGARVFWQKTIAAPAPARFIRDVQGHEIRGLKRRGKFVVAALSGGYTLLVHLRMSGQLHVIRPGDRKRQDSHDRVVLALGDGRELRFEDARKFGRVWLVKNPCPVLGKLGPEPFGLSATDFAKGVAARSRLLKPLLLDQTFIAGVGNIYADEALWAAKLHPRRKSDSLSPEETARLRKEIQNVLRRGIRNLGTTLGAGFRNMISVAFAHGPPILAAQSERKSHYDSRLHRPRQRQHSDSSHSCLLHWRHRRVLAKDQSPLHRQEAQRTQKDGIG